jgi:DNA-binding response OmpR family regulator
MFSVERLNTNAPASFRVHNEIIMILSSESELRTPTQRALEALGYPVLTAQNQNQADALFRSFDGAI